jgi:hypothetical protein
LVGHHIQNSRKKLIIEHTNGHTNNSISIETKLFVCSSLFAEINDNSWYVDYGVSQHMTSNKNVSTFQNIDPIQRVYLGDNSSYPFIVKDKLYFLQEKKNQLKIYYLY